MSMMDQKKMNWHRLTGEESLRQLGSRTDGLSGKEASVRLRKGGSNTLFAPRTPKNTLLRKLLTDPALLLFVSVAVLTVCFSELFSAISALTLFGIWCVFAGWQIMRISREQSLIRLSAIPTVTVFRNKKRLTVSAKNIVTGDVLLLRRGDIVPADCRLLYSSELRVRFFDCASSEEKKKTVIQHKKADTVYPYHAEIYAPDHENLLYAGSEVIGGTAKAVVFATGTDTFLGKLGETLLREPFDRDSKLLSCLYPYFRLLGFLSLILLFPLGLIGLLIAPEAQSGMRVFLPVCAWVASTSAILPYCYIQILLHSGVRRLFTKNEKKNGAVIKSVKAMDRLPYLTDLFVLGRAAFSDGQLHFDSAFTGDGVIYAKDGASSELQPLCEAFCLLESALERLPDHAVAVAKRIEPYLAELTAISGYDREALELRVTKRELFRGKTERILDVETADEQFRLRFYYTAATLFGCGEYQQSNGGRAVLDHQKRGAYQAFVAHAHQRGSSVVTVLKEQGAKTYLLGCVAKCEAFLPGCVQTVSELERMGIRVRLFLEGETRTDEAYAAELMPNAKIMRASREVALSSVSSEHRVFLGYSQRAVAEYIRELKKRGRTVGTVSCDITSRGALAESSIAIACESVSGDALESQCVPILRRDSDVLIAGASSAGGGLAAVKQAVSVLRETLNRAKYFFECLLSLRWMQAVFMVLSVFTGVGAIPAFAMIYSTFFADMFLLMQTLCAPMKVQTDDRPTRFHDGYFRGFFHSRRRWLIPSLPPIILMAVIAVLYRLSLLSAENCYALIFLSMLLMESLLLTVGEYCLTFSKKTVQGLLLLWIPALAVMILSVCFPAVARLTELGSWKLSSVIVAVICPILSLSALLFLPKITD